MKCRVEFPQPGVLPTNWDSLTPQEKTGLNPFDCDHETHWVSAEDGSCINQPSPPENDVIDICFDGLSESSPEGSCERVIEELAGFRYAITRHEESYRYQVIGLWH